MPYEVTGRSFHLFNWLIQLHFKWVVIIYSLGSGHTHTNTQGNSLNKSNFKKPDNTSLSISVKFMRNTSRWALYFLHSIINLSFKPMGLWPPFFPMTTFISICTNLSGFHGAYFHFPWVSFQVHMVVQCMLLVRGIHSALLY